MKFMLLPGSMNTIPGTLLPSTDSTGASIISKMAPAVPAVSVLPTGLPTNRAGLNAPGLLGASHPTSAAAYAELLPSSILWCARPQTSVPLLAWHRNLAAPEPGLYGSFKAHPCWVCVQDRQVMHPPFSSITMALLVGYKFRNVSQSRSLLLGQGREPQENFLR